MARPIRFIQPGMTVEVTIRTIQSRLLLRPSKELNEIVIGVLGRAQAMYPVSIHVIIFVSNHYHLIITTPDALALARFMNFVNSNIAREVGRLHSWREKFWGRRYRAIPVLDEVSLVDRVQYLLAHGCKEGLVARPKDWPGVSSLDAMLTGKPMRGTWFNRTAEWFERRSGGQPDPMEFAEAVEVRLTPLPCWDHLSPCDQRRRLRSLIRDIELETRQRNLDEVRTPPGRQFILSQDPHSFPCRSKKSPASHCHTSIHQLREEFIAAYMDFLDAYIEASSRLRAGIKNVEFPPDSFPPSLPFNGLCLDPAPT